MQLLPDHMTKRTKIKGVAIYTVFENTPAAVAGLEGLKVSPSKKILFGDIITAIDNIKVTTIEELQAVLDPHSPGDNVTLSITNRIDSRNVKIKLVAER
jgi:S1-C subfamily serine protease